MAAFGIEAFTTTTKPFSAAFKQEVDDFQVIEISLDRQEADLTDKTSLPSPADMPQNSGSGPPAVPGSAPCPPQSKCDAEAPLESLLSESHLQDVMALASKGGEGIGPDDACDVGVIDDKQKRLSVFVSVKRKWAYLTTKSAGQGRVQVQADGHYLTLRALLCPKDVELVVLFAAECIPSPPKTVYVAAGVAREVRTRIHHAVAKCYPFLHTKTVEVGAGPCIAVFKSANAARDRKRKADALSAKGERWLQFVLEKRNVETMEAIGRLADVCRVQPSAFSNAGIKDKRGVTRQFVTADWTVKAPKLLSFNASNVPMWVGNLRYVAQPLSNGRLFGNRFRVVLRGVAALKGDVEEALEAVRATGFINYYGPQRFGDERYDVQSYMVGKLLLLRRWKDAVALLMQPDSQSADEVRRAKEHWLATEDAHATLRLMPKARQTETQVLRGLNRYAGTPDVYEKALMNIPYTLRTLILHSYCSHIWNRVATARVRRHGLTVVAGDLVVAAEGEASDAPEDPSEAVRVVPHVVTEAEAGAGAYHIRHLVLPMPGKQVRYPENDIGALYQDLFAADGVAQHLFAEKIVQVALPGAYRKLLNFPIDLQYSWHTAPATSTAPAGAGDGVTGNSARAAGGIDSCTCDSAAAEDVAEGATRDSATLGGVVEGGARDSASVAGVEDGASAGGAHRMDAGGDDAAAPSASVSDVQLHLDFKLQSAAYATIFLREVTKNAM